MLIEKFIEDTKSSTDLISLISFIGQLSRDNIEDVEPLSKLMFTILSKHFQNDFCENYVQSLNFLQTHNYLEFLIDDQTYKIYIFNKQLFQIIYLSSLKYLKIKLNGNLTLFFERVFEILIKNNGFLLTQEYLHIFRMIEITLNKKDVILSDQMNILLLKYLNQLVSSPLIGFKSYCYGISKIILKNLNNSDRKFLTQLHNLPNKSIDSNDLLKLISNDEIKRVSVELNYFVIYSFNNNCNSKDGYFFYDKILSAHNFDEFTTRIWPMYFDYLQNEEGESYQSILKYWIPTTVKYYKSNVYDFLKTQKINFSLKAYILFEVKKRNDYSKDKYDSDSLRFVQYVKTTKIGIKILTTYLKITSNPDQVELNAMKFYLNSYANCELSADILKYFKSLISQVFLVSHVVLSKKIVNEHLINEYECFLKSLCQYCEKRIRGQNCEIASQLLKLIWDCANDSSARLELNYKIDKEYNYAANGNLFYQRLKLNNFWQDNLLNNQVLNIISDVFTQDFVCCNTLLDLTSARYLPYLKCEKSQNPVELLNKASKLICLQNKEILRIYTKFYMIYNKINSNAELISILTKFFYDKLKTDFNTDDLYYSALILDILITVAQHDSEANFVELTQTALKYIGQLFDDDNDLSNLDAKSAKVLEAFINNVLECLIESRRYWNEFDKNDVLNCLCKIIQKSNMKRPVSLSINAVQQLLSSQSVEDREIKLKFLDHTLKSLYSASLTLNLKIRRNPEYRLVIHALILADRSTKYYLEWTVGFLLDVLSDPTATDSTLSSALNTLEVLISDNTIYQYTLKSIPEIIKHCIHLFNKQSWIVRNADLQLLKSLIERFLGVSLHSEIALRPKTIQDLFYLYPNLIKTFNQTLSQPELNDSALIVMLFFSESQIEKNLFANQNLSRIIEDFRCLFVNLIKKNEYYFGRLAVRSFTSLCLENDIPNVVNDIVNFILLNYDKLKTNIVKNLVSLLKELIQKWKIMQYLPGNPNLQISISRLTSHLSQYRCFYFHLLSIQVNDTQYVVDNVVELLRFGPRAMDYEQRIVLNNNMGFLLNQLETNRLIDFLQKILVLNIPEYIQLKILNSLVDRVRSCNSNEVLKILDILIGKLVILNDSKKLLLTAYSKTILLFSDVLSLASEPLNANNLFLIRNDYNTNNIYKILVYVMVVSSLCEENLESDLKFLAKAVKQLQCYLNDDELLIDIANTIKYFYACLPINYRYDLVKLIFYFLLNESTSVEMCRFISKLTSSQTSSALVAFRNLFNPNQLNVLLKNPSLCHQLLEELYCYVNNMNLYSESETYYLIENEFTIPLETVKLIIKKCLCTACH